MIAAPDVHVPLRLSLLEGHTAHYINVRFDAADHLKSLFLRRGRPACGISTRPNKLNSASVGNADCESGGRVHANCPGPLRSGRGTAAQLGSRKCGVALYLMCRNNLDKLTRNVSPSAPAAEKAGRGTFPTTTAERRQPAPPQTTQLASPQTTARWYTSAVEN
jgi:hypothetical protein